VESSPVAEPGEYTDISRVMAGDNVSKDRQLPSMSMLKRRFRKARNASLGYTCFETVVKSRYSNAVVYSGQNLLIVTHYKAPDPEVSSNGNDPQGKGSKSNSVCQWTYHYYRIERGVLNSIQTASLQK